MANLIQIKRSLTTATPASLANGEMAFTANGDALFIGSNGAVIAIGGKRVPGTLTANQALVANATSYLDTIKVANLVPTSISANGTQGTAGQVLVSDGANVYWGTGTSGTNTQIQFNDSGVANASGGFTFNKTANALFVGNTVTVGANVVLSVSSLSIGNSTVNTVATATSLSIGNSTFNTTANSTSLTVTDISVTNASIVKIYANGAHGTDGQILSSNSSGGLFFAAPVATNLDGLTDVIISSASVGQIIIAQANGTFLNKTISGDITISNTGVVAIAADSVALGTDTTGNYVSTITAGNGLSGNATGETSTVTIAVVANSGIAANSTGVFVVANNGITSNASGVFVNVGADGGLTTNSAGVFVFAGDGLSTNATGVHVGAGSGVSVDGTNVSVNANSGIVANATGVFAKAANGISVDGSGINVTAGTGVTVNTSGVHIGQAISTTSNVTFNDLTVNGNTVIGSNFSDVVTINAGVNSNILPTANVTHNLGNNTLRFNEIYAANTRTTYLAVDQNVEISGNLTVSGSLVTINVSTLAVTDPLIQLAANNINTDTLDIGFFGNYNTGGGASEFAGLFRDASTDSFKLFKGLQDAPTTVVDIAGTGYTTAALEAFLTSGALVSNSTAVTLTANGTVAVNITANSLSLSTALPGGSGGTGLSSYTAEQILVANSSNGFRKLNVGTDGYVLQVVSGAVAYGTLDGGSF